jgi:hypothetical protein
MRNIFQYSGISGSTKMVVDEILAQIERHDEALRGVRAIIVEKRLSYKGGEFIVVSEEEHEERWPPAEAAKDEKRDQFTDPFDEFLTSDLVLRELPGGDRNEIHVHASVSGKKKFDLTDFPLERFLSFHITLSRVPARLLRAEMGLSNAPRWIRWLFRQAEMTIEFGYCRDVPIPMRGSMRLLTRGIGSLRYGMGYESEIMKIIE